MVLKQELVFFFKASVIQVSKRMGEAIVIAGAKKEVRLFEMFKGGLPFQCSQGMREVSF